MSFLDGLGQVISTVSGVGRAAEEGTYAVARAGQLQGTVMGYGNVVQSRFQEIRGTRYSNQAYGNEAELRSNMTEDQLRAYQLNRGDYQPANYNGQEPGYYAPQGQYAPQGYPQGPGQQQGRQPQYYDPRSGQQIQGPQQGYPQQGNSRDDAENITRAAQVFADFHDGDATAQDYVRVLREVAGPDGSFTITRPYASEGGRLTLRPGTYGAGPITAAFDSAVGLDAGKRAELEAAFAAARSETQQTAPTTQAPVTPAPATQAPATTAPTTPAPTGAAPTTTTPASTAPTGSAPASGSTAATTGTGPTTSAPASGSTTTPAATTPASSTTTETPAAGVTAVEAASGGQARFYATGSLMPKIAANQVDDVQRNLVAAGFDLSTSRQPDGIDGKWGPKTQSAFETVCREAGIADLNAVDFTNPNDPQVARFNQAIAARIAAGGVVPPPPAPAPVVATEAPAAAPAAAAPAPAPAPVEPHIQIPSVGRYNPSNTVGLPQFGQGSRHQLAEQGLKEIRGFGFDTFLQDTDGRAGSRSTGAIRRFQEQQGIPQTGQADPITLQLIGIAAAAHNGTYDGIDPRRPIPREIVDAVVIANTTPAPSPEQRMAALVQQNGASLPGVTGGQDVGRGNSQQANGGAAAGTAPQVG